MIEISELKDILDSLGIEEVNFGASNGDKWTGGGQDLSSISPINGQVIAKVKQADGNDFERVVESAYNAFKFWRMVPAPKRGEIVRQLGLELRKNKETLGKLVTIEMGKIIQEGLGEVQEMIDICDMATGMSRQLSGITTHSERAKHRMYEQWHPLGILGLITAFNFPVAVWSWNTAIALICGDTVIWKPASATPLTAIACQKIVEKVLKRNDMPPGICNLLIGKGSIIGEMFLHDRRIPLISYTGSTKMGKHIGSVVGERLGKTILELGGNNGVIITPDADLPLSAKYVLFGAVGTAGQRCTTTRRVIIHESVYEKFIELLRSYYEKVTIGNPLDKSILMGPMVDTTSVQMYIDALKIVQEQGGKILWGGEKLSGADFESGCYVTPSVALVDSKTPIVQEETFAPLLYVIKYSKDIEEAIEIHNDVPQGLSSAIFTNNLIESEYFLSHKGSDCGIANVNLGTSGAEIGGAFGGEKETGGGRESGSDAWKYYMRRQTNTINWSQGITLAQGIKFGE